MTTSTTLIYNVIKIKQLKLIYNLLVLTVLYKYKNLITLLDHKPNTRYKQNINALLSNLNKAVDAYIIIAIFIIITLYLQILYYILFSSISIESYISVCVISDGSSKTDTCLSLNYVLLKGPEIQYDFSNILTLFVHKNMRFPRTNRKCTTKFGLHRNIAKIKKIFCRDNKNNLCKYGSLRNCPGFFFSYSVLV